MLAELSVSNPWLPFTIFLKGEGVYQNRLPFVKLDIVSATIFQGKPIIESCFLNNKGSESSILDLAKAPFIRIRNKRDWFGRNNFIDLIISG